MNKIEPIPWRGIRALEKLILLVLPLLALAVLVLPFLDQAFLRRLSRLIGARSLISWLANGFNTWIIGAVLLILWVALFLLIRHRLVGNKRLWAGTGCPNCMERELVRVSRKPSDRFYGLIGIPAYRYACRNCTWRGLRIARHEHSPEREAEREQALARFQPDGALAFNPGPRVHTEDSVIAATSPESDLDSIFHDAGDVGLTVEQTETTRTEDHEELVEEANHHADAEPIEGMEWLWRSSADN